MARGYSPPESPLSSVRSSDHSDEDGHDMDGGGSGGGSRPSKRLKVDDGASRRASRASSAAAAAAAAGGHDVTEPPDQEHVPEPDPLEGMSDVSSDTSGDIPSSPVNARLDEEDFQEQVSACDWDGCQAGDQGNMDRLVEHIHNSHIENRQKRYTCEWKSCTRKGLTHASGYALKAHMRSHTREKPFYCYLPECDRSFTRSDALAKHMRTVHETEALRPSDPVPKSMQSGPPGKASKLKIIIKTPQSHGTTSNGGGGGEDGADEAGHGEDGSADYFTALTSEMFSPGELAFPVDKLYRKCYWEAKWAAEVGETLARECREWEGAYYREWLEKEVLLAQVIESEVGWHERRQAVLAASAELQKAGAAGASNGTGTSSSTAAAATAMATTTAKEEQENGVEESASQDVGKETAAIVTAEAVAA